MIRNPRPITHHSQREWGLLTAEQKREIHRQAVERLEEGSRVGAILEKVNAEGEEELNLEGELC